MDPVTLGIMGGSALFGGIASLFGASSQAKAAKQAAEIQANAAREAGRLTRDAADQGATDVTNAIGHSNALMAGAAGDSNNLLSEFYRNYTSGNEPYAQAGANAAASLESLAKGPGFQFSADDPSFQFRLQEGMKALERSAAARGVAMGGGALKALTRYGQDYASTEYGKAFERFQQDRAARAGMFSNLMGAGQTAQQQNLGAGTFAYGGMSGNLMDSGRFQASNSMAGTTTAADLRLRGAEGYGNALSNAAAAGAAGHVGSANAWAQGMSGAGNNLMSGAMLYALLAGKTPAKPPTP